VLYLFATSSVRGFAYFLGLSTALDLILAYCFMWPFVSVLARRPALVRMGGIGIGAGLDVPALDPPEGIGLKPDGEGVVLARPYLRPLDDAGRKGDLQLPAVLLPDQSPGALHRLFEGQLDGRLVDRLRARGGLGGGP